MTRINMASHWERLTDVQQDIARSARMLTEAWTRHPPTNPTEVESLESAALDVRDCINQLINECIFLRGYLEGMPPCEPEVEEEKNARGDRIIHITAGTAPCSEIAESFGVSVAKVVALARKLELQAAGEVTWELADGTITKARSYNLAQWKAMRSELVSKGGLWSRKDFIAPQRIYPDSEEA